MMYFGFSIANPWCNRWKNVWCRDYKLPIKNKFLELEVFKDSTIVSFSFRLATKQSHGGVMIDAGLLGYSFLFNLYDSRHWNAEAGRYYNENEEGMN